MDLWDIGMLNFWPFFATLPVIPMFESTLLPIDWIMLHNIGQKYIAETSDKLFWDFHAVSKTSQEKVATYLEEHKHSSALLQ